MLQSGNCDPHQQLHSNNTQSSSPDQLRPLNGDQDAASTKMIRDGDYEYHMYRNAHLLQQQHAVKPEPPKLSHVPLQIAAASTSVLSHYNAASSATEPPASNVPSQYQLQECSLHHHTPTSGNYIAMYPTMVQSPSYPATKALFTSQEGGEQITQYEPPHVNNMSLPPPLIVPTESPVPSPSPTTAFPENQHPIPVSTLQHHSQQQQVVSSSQSMPPQLIPTSSINSHFQAVQPKHEPPSPPPLWSCSINPPHVPTHSNVTSIAPVTFGTMGSLIHTTPHPTHPTIGLGSTSGASSSYPGGVAMNAGFGTISPLSPMSPVTHPVIYHQADVGQFCCSVSYFYACLFVWFVATVFLMICRIFN